MSQRIAIYTDGSCNPNPGKGGFGAVIKYPDRDAMFYCDGDAFTTNNQMEMQAAILGIEALLKMTPEPFRLEIEVWTDSQYLINGITKWIKGWKKRNWQTKDNAPVKNKDLWIKLDSLNLKFQKIRWMWVKGHSGHWGNEIADTLANMGRDIQYYAEPSVEQVADWQTGVWKASDEPLAVVSKDAEEIIETYASGGVW